VVYNITTSYIKERFVLRWRKYVFYSIQLDLFKNKKFYFLSLLNKDIDKLTKTLNAGREFLEAARNALEEALEEAFPDDFAKGALTTFFSTFFFTSFFAIFLTFQ
jgi:hypothetical protein